MASTRVLFLILVLFPLLFCHGSVATEEYRERPRFGSQHDQCQLEKLNALEPSRRAESEAGITEHWDENDQQLQCAGVAATRHTVRQRGLVLPEFSNAPRLVYIIQGRGYGGVVIPGCPETFHSSEQSEQSEEPGGRRQRGQRREDQHQRIRQFRQGDIIALPAGVAQWCYNDGEEDLIAVTILDTNNVANQLDQNPRKFYLAGREGRQTEQRERTHDQRSSNNILSGFDADLLSEALGVEKETVRKIQGHDERRGDIIRVEEGLQVLRPKRGRKEEERERTEEEREESSRWGRGNNGIEEAICNWRLKANIDDPSRADVYNPRGGRLTTLNSQKLPILRFLQLSAERGVLHRNALIAPHWIVNAHSIVYVTRGHGRVQIVGNDGRRVLDGDLRQGQLVVVPQNFVVVKQARSERFEWVAFRTNEIALASQIAGKGSVFRGLPEDVLANSYRLSREEARRLKHSRGEEVGIFAPSSHGRASE